METVTILFRGAKFVGVVDEFPPDPPLDVVTEFEAGGETYQIIRKPKGAAAAAPAAEG